jgi:spermidine dehydrogenase
MACWHSVIPWVCPEVPADQREALRYGAKVPLVYTSVALRNRRAFEQRGVQSVSLPGGGYHDSLGLVMPVSVGSYAYSRQPDEPVVVHLTRVPASPGEPAREQHRLGRLELLTTPFEDIEARVRDEMGRVLGPGGFDADRDIAAITVNRWPHGYAYQYNSLDDPFWLEGGELPCAVARRPVGRRISIANSDAAAYAYTDAAIDQARRAVSELVERI